MWCGSSPCEPRSSGIRLLPRRPPGLRLRARRRGPGPAFGDERVDLLRRQVVVVAVVQPHHRRVLARSEALDLLIAEKPVGGDLVRALDADRALHVRDDLVRAPQRAAEVRADVQAVLADRIEVEQRVEGRDALHVAGIQLQRRRHLAHRVRRQVPELLLGEVERRHHGRAGLWVSRRKLADLLEHVLRESGHLSTSPSTVSALPMMAIRSATMWFIAIRSSGCRLTNEAARNLTRRGLWVPSLTT